MKNEQLQRTLRLLRRTGDRGIVLDMESDDVFVLMDADNYEDLLDGANAIRLPSSGADGDSAKNDDEDSDGTGDFVLDDLIDLEERRGGPLNETIEKGEAPLPSRPINKEFKKLDFSEVWPVARPSLEVAEESLADVPEDVEPEEEKFYLEPVE